MSENKAINYPWDSDSMHDSFAEADKRRNFIKETKEGMQAKVKRLNSNNKFLVKTRLDPALRPVKEEKSGKSKRRNKKNSDRRKFDPSSAI
jgi:hypothetical protein